MYLSSFWEAIKPEEQFPEDNCDRKIQLKMITSVPALGEYPPRQRRVHNQLKVMLRVDMVFPARNSSNR